MYPYGERWRNLYRPQALLDAGGRVRGPLWRGNTASYEYLGGAQCRLCGFADWEELKGRRSKLHVAHLDGDPFHNDRSNRLAVCPTCHRRHDLAEVGKKIERTRKKNRVLGAMLVAIKRDQDRPLLNFRVER